MTKRRFVVVGATTADSYLKFSYEEFIQCICMPRSLRKKKFPNRLGQVVMMIRDWAPAILPVIAYELDPAIGPVKQLVCNDVHEIFAATADKVYKTKMPAGGDPLVWPKNPILKCVGVGNAPIVISHNTTP